MTSRDDPRPYLCATSLKFLSMKLWVLLKWVVVAIQSHALAVHALASIERRRFSLQPWTTRDENGNPHAPTPLGWAVEERTMKNQASRTWNFTVAWSGEPEVTVHLPWNRFDSQASENDEKKDDLSASLWDASVAGAILCRSPSFLQYTNKTKTVLELGSGLGLLGSVAGVSAKSATLSDHDQHAVQALNGMAQHNKGQVTARYLEWKDNHTNVDTASPFDIILAADVAYYFYLLRPLMNTIQAFLGQVVVITGQANRQSQWDLYDNIKNGCYNQQTDEREGPWPGRTRALLYNLKVGRWFVGDDDLEQETELGTVLPILVIHHESSPAGGFAFSISDHEVTPEDKDAISISF
jgi:predicted nicotinamide N-methyase